ncbi:DEAD/DEAH box helicase [Streptomyces sp. NBC_00257]|uniref:SNF2-related protein n=1 Tax=unclassified Streptomyces TaxID=2593676 RepID=UPI00225B93BE|nr:MULTISPECIES: DEAD/DEAH box helicase [unclassified Streptomyces]MCX5431566.1 DEAD/DEAH box helicase [Streptomyces sp. NBC_00062]
MAKAAAVIERHGGVLIADEVGLGKTFIGGELIRRAERAGLGPILVLCPAHLKRSVWDQRIKGWNLAAQVRSYSQLLYWVDKNLEADGPWPQYQMIVCDEAHYLRNPHSGTRLALGELLARHPQRPRMVLLTATPVNNRGEDLAELLDIATPAPVAEMPTVRGWDPWPGRRLGAKELRRRCRRVLSLEKQELRELRDEMNELLLRRTRRYISSTDPALDGRPTFPEVVQHPIRYRLTPAMLSLFVDVLDAAADPDLAEPPDHQEAMAQLRGPHPRHTPLTLAVYAPQRYAVDGADPPSWVELLLPLIRSLLLKRIESSPAAFAETAQRMADRTKQALDDLDANRVRITISPNRRKLMKELLREWLSSSPDEEQEESPQQEEIREFLSEVMSGLSGSATGCPVPTEYYRPADHFDAPAFRAALEHDHAVLEQLAIEAAAARREDPKAAAFLTLLDILEGKALVFSEARDTTDDLGARIEKHLRNQPGSRYRGRFANLGRRERPHHKDIARTLAGFCPDTAAPAPVRIGDIRPKDEYDLLLTTDMLSEGVNLQQAQSMVNYDLPWNPMRLAQRIGRVDRIGSPHETIQCYTFLPDEVLDVWLRLIDRLRAKTATAARLVGVSTSLFPDAPVEALDYATLVEQIVKPHSTTYMPPPLDELQRMWLHRARAVPELRRRIESLTHWAGAVHPEPADAPMVVYCFQVVRTDGAAPAPVFCRVYGGARDGATSLDADRCLREIDLDPTDWLEGGAHEPEQATAEQRELVLALLDRARSEVAGAFGIGAEDADRKIRLVAWMLRPGPGDGRQT